MFIAVCTFLLFQNYMGSDNSCYNYGNPVTSVSGQFYNQSMSQPIDSMMSPAYQQQYQGSNFAQQQFTDGPGPQYPNMGMPSPSSSAAVVTSRHAYQGHVPGSPLMGQSSMRHSHPHLRNSGQTPQEVANNILHMAASSYPTNNTIQVPLSKTRSAPYHIPSRSPNYSTKPQDSQQQMCSDYGQGHFAYPSPPHQSQLLMQSRDPRLSPLSPASAGMMASPHSHQSGRCVPSSSPCSLNSPSKGLIRSPGPSSQLMSSPQRGQYQMPSMNTSNQRMVSPVPANQQLKVTVPSSMSQPFQQCYYGNSSQYQSFQQPVSAGYSPSSVSQNSDCGQFTNSPGSQGRHLTHSPGGRSGHFSNISSPYTPGSSSYLSPNQAHSSPSVTQNISDGGLASSPNMKQCSSPLQSLQKLCMLPDKQVVDPKTVVKEACVSSSCDVSAKNTDNWSSSSDIVSTNTPSDSNCANTPSDSSCTPTFSDLVSGTDNEITRNLNSSEAIVNPEMKYQPKKMMLLRAAKEDLCSTQSEDTIQKNNSEPEAEDSKDHKIKTDEPEQDIDENKSGIEKQSFVETVGSDSAASEKVCDAKSETEDYKQVSDEKSSDVTEKNSSTLESGDTSVNDKLSNDMKPDLETSLQDNENTQDSSQSSETCDDPKTDVSTSGNVQIATADIQEVKVQSKDVEIAYESDSLSENESQIVVCKDINKTYSKQERLKSFEITPRIRGDSTGSFSDEIANSDFEYEDHIGCDDIETGFSDIENKSNEMIEESLDDTKDLNSDITNGNVVIDRVMITGSHWNKNGQQSLSVCSDEKHRRNGRMKNLPFMTKVSDIDSDDVPSPLGGDDVDGLEGPVGIDNGDGTVSVTRPSHLRQRKTPVKYKDTSFFQGDFVFVEEEEEEYLQQIEPKQKITKKVIDVNHNPKKNGIVKKSGAACSNNDVSSKTKLKFQPSSETSVSGNLEKTMKLLAKQTEKLKTEKPKSTCNVNNIKILKRGSDGDLKVLKTVCVVEAFKKDEKAKSNVPKSVLSLDKVPKSKSDSNHTPIQNTAAVVTRKSSKQESNIDKNKSVKKRVSRKPINGVKTEDISCDKKVTAERTQKGNTLVDRGKEKVLNKSKSKKVTEDDKPDDFEVIEIDSEDSDDAVNKTDAKSNVTNMLNDGKMMTQPNTSSVVCQNLVSDEESHGRNFMFSLVEDEIIDEALISEDFRDTLETNNKAEVVEHKTASAKLPNKRSNSGSNLKCKSTSAKSDKPRKSGKGIKRKAFIDDDPDFDLGPSKRPFKSLKFDKTNDVSSLNKYKKKTDKWANFKGPKIIFEGEKETPKHCVVINDPYEENVSKKTKVTAQNVTRIEISQLPSDKSVLIPYNDTSESENWTCALCGKHSSFKFLGDLFGPYTVETMSDDMLDLSPKVRLSTKKRKSEDGQSCANKGIKSGKRAGSLSREVNEWKEVWIHEACSVYSDGVFLIGSKIYGLQEAVRIASQTVSICRVPL